MSDVIHRLVARAQVPGDAGRALQPRPDWQLLPAVPAWSDHEADPESASHEPWPRPASSIAPAPAIAPPGVPAVPASRHVPAPPAAATRELHSTRGATPGRVRVPTEVASRDERVTGAAVEFAVQQPASVPASRPAPAVQALPGAVVPAAVVPGAPVAPAVTATSGAAPIPSPGQPRQAPPVVARDGVAMETEEAEPVAAATTNARPAARTKAPPAAQTFEPSGFRPRVVPRVALEAAADDGAAPAARRVSSAHTQHDFGRAAETPAVHVTIGRLEIRAPHAPQPVAGTRAPRGTGLDQYLRARAGGDRR